MYWALWDEVLREDSGKMAVSGHQESVSWPRQQLTLAESGGTLVQVRSLPRLQFQRKIQIVNCGLGQSTHLSPSHSHGAGSDEHVPGATYTQPVGVNMGKKDTVLQISGIWVLSSDLWLLLLITEVQAKGWATVVGPLPRRKPCLWLKWFPVDLRDWYPPIQIFPLLGARY